VEDLDGLTVGRLLRVLEEGGAETSLGSFRGWLMETLSLAEASSLGFQSSLLPG